MNLYLVTRKIPSPDHDVYLGFVCVATSIEAAASMHPSGRPDYWQRKSMMEWVASPQHVYVEFLGLSHEPTERIVFVNYRAG